MVIPEDFRKNQFVLKPIIERMLNDLGIRARVQVCMAEHAWQELRPNVNRGRSQ